MMAIGYLAVIIVMLQGGVLLISLFRGDIAQVSTCRLYGFILMICLSVIAFCTFPNDGTDLKRYYEILSEMHRYTPQELFSTWIYGSTPLTVLLFSFVHVLSIYNLLPGIATSLILFIHTYIVCSFVKKYSVRISCISLFVLVWLGIAGVRAVLTGVRQHLAVAFFALSVCQYFIKEKKNVGTVAFALAAVLIHTGTIPFVVLLLIYIFVRKHAIEAVVALYIAVLTFSNISFSNPYLLELQQKLIEYNDISYPDIRFFLVRIIVFAVMMILPVLNRQEAYSFGLEKYFPFYESLGILAIITLNNQILFDRIFTAQATVSLPMLYIFFDQGNLCRKKLNTVLAVLLLFLLSGIFAYQFVDLKTSWRLWNVLVS